MKPKSKILLIIDGIVNLLLGTLLLLFPFGTAKVFGVPQSNSNFYPTILGAVIFGIGISLLLEVYRKPRGVHGLGLAGAITINFCGAGALTLGFIELFGKSWKCE